MCERNPNPTNWPSSRAASSAWREVRKLKKRSLPCARASAVRASRSSCAVAKALRSAVAGRRSSNRYHSRVASLTKRFSRASEQPPDAAPPPLPLPPQATSSAQRALTAAASRRRIPPSGELRVQLLQPAMLQSQLREQRAGLGAEARLFPALDELLTGLLVPGVGQPAPFRERGGKLLVFVGDG